MNRFTRTSILRVVGLLIVIATCTSSAFGQQFLWSTIEQDSLPEKYIPFEYVNNEILKFYDHYDKHYDFSGFSKERFIEESDYGFDDWKWIDEITDATVFALRSNMGNGSFVLVMFVSETNINLLIFSNELIDRNFNYQSNSKYEKEKFETWLETLKD